MIVTILYYLMATFVAGLIVWNIFKTKKWQEEVLYIVILIPFVLRVLRIK